jgi:hypothetical protein
LEIQFTREKDITQYTFSLEIQVVIKQIFV